MYTVFLCHIIKTYLVGIEMYNDPDGLAARRRAVPNPTACTRLMTPSSATEWTAGLLASDPPRSKSLLTTIFGDSIVPHAGMVWLGSLIELLGPFGVNDRLLRTTVFRLAQEGWLIAERDGRRSSYSITAEAKERFARAYRRIYAAPPADWDGNWTLVMGMAGDLDPVARTALRKELQWEGYYIMAPGFAAHPSGDTDSLRKILERTGLADTVYVCRMTALPEVNRRSLGELAGDGWDLSGVADSYRHFIRQFQPLEALLEAGPALAPQEAFVLRTLLIHAYRRVQLHDPQLPAQMLPDPWPGAQAYMLTRELYRKLHAAAEEYLMGALRKEDPQAPVAEVSFYQRFGGLD
jgi:phenylacetic acid degradation operon negative regulatory protein